MEIAGKDVPFKKLKRYRQSTGAYCGPAALQIMLSNFDIEAKQIDIANAGSSVARVDRQGMSFRELAKAAKAIVPHLTFWYKHDSSLEDLKRVVVDYKYPVGVDWQGIFANFEYGTEINAPDDDNEDGDEGEDEEIEEDDGSVGDEGHYCVVTDVNLEAGYLRLVDPYGSYSGRDRVLATEVFQERWWDDLMEIDRVGGLRKYTFESRLMFTLVPKGETFPKELGMKEL